VRKVSKSKIDVIDEKFRDVFFQISCTGCGEIIFTLPYKEGTIHRIKCGNCGKVTYIKVTGGGIKIYSGEEVCTNCNGTGVCPECNGTGKTTCSQCDGKGYYYDSYDDEYHICEKCGGRGYKSEKP